MKKLPLILLLVLLALALATTVYLRSPAEDVFAPGSGASPSPEPTPTPTPVPMPTPTPVPTPTPTPEPEPDYLTLSFVGDLTLASHQYTNDFAKKMGEDYSYPFSHVVQYFAEDEYTIGNLECSFSDQRLYSAQTFYFLAPSAWANILVEGGVDFVTTANNHTEDFHTAGMEDTWAALEAVGVPFGKNEEAQIVTTPSGLKLGIYCVFNNGNGAYIPDTDKAIGAIAELRAAGADYIICAFHWGIELYYHPLDAQIELAHACIDAGADLIYGSHPHVLEPVEEYNGGLILYSMGNFCFGGNTSPKDPDSAIVQVVLKRDIDGSVTTEGYTLIPCCVSSRPVLEGYTGSGYNDYRPTPYVEGTELYERALSKIDGSYEGPNGQADYTSWHNSHG